MSKENSKTSYKDEITIKIIISSIMQWIKYLYSQYILILLFSLLIGIICFFYAYGKKPQYVAELTFVLESANASANNSYSGLASSLGIDLGGGNSTGAFEGDNLFPFMKSSSMINNTLLAPVQIGNKTITLADYYIKIYNLRDKWTDPKYKAVSFSNRFQLENASLEQNTILKALYNQIVTSNLFVGKQDKKSSLLSIRFISEDELLSKFFTEILCKKVSNLYIETKTKKAAENVAILQKQADSLRSVLNSSIKGVAIAIDANPNKNPALQILNAPSQSKQLNIQANQVIFGQLLQNLEASKVSLRKETPLIQIIDEPILPLEIQSVSLSKWFLIGLFVGGFLVCSVLIFIRIIKDNL